MNSFQFMSHIAVCIFMLHYISVIYFTEKTQGENVHLGIVLLRWWTLPGTSNYVKMLHIKITIYHSKIYLCISLGATMCDITYTLSTCRTFCHAVKHYLSKRFYLSLSDVFICHCMVYLSVIVWCIYLSLSDVFICHCLVYIYVIVWCIYLSLSDVFICHCLM